MPFAAGVVDVSPQADAGEDLRDLRPHEAVCVGNESNGEHPGLRPSAPVVAPSLEFCQGALPVDRFGKPIRHAPKFDHDATWIVQCPDVQVDEPMRCVQFVVRGRIGKASNA